MLFSVSDEFDEKRKEELLNDPKFLEAVNVTLGTGKVSTSLLQRKCGLGYGRAANYIDGMEQLGIVSEKNGQTPRDVLITRQGWEKMLSGKPKKEKTGILLLLSDGFEEVEALTPLDMIRRAGLDIKTVGISGKVVKGSHNIPVIADCMPGEVDDDDVSLVILPGGMPGTLGLDASPFVDGLLKKVYEKGGRLAAICAAPSVLGKRGYLNGKHAVCYPGFENQLLGAEVCDAAVVTDGKITTSRGMGAAFAFGYELVNVLAGKETADKIALSTMPEGLPESILRF